MRCPSGIVIRRFSRFGARAEAAALVISILLLLGSASTALGGTVGMMLPYSASTSAGVYDSDDRLVRTLWSGRILDPTDTTEDTRALRAFNDTLATDPRVVVVQTTVRDGVTLIRRAG